MSRFHVPASKYLHFLDAMLHSLATTCLSCWLLQSTVTQMIMMVALLNKCNRSNEDAVLWALYLSSWYTILNQKARCNIQ